MAKKQNQPNIPKPVAGKTQASKPSEPKKSFSLQAKLAFLLGIIALIVYANTLKNDYVLDDFTVIKNNSIVTKGMSAIPQIFATPYRRGWFITTNDLYRPLSLAMFATEYQMFDGSAKAGHFVNIVLFAGGVIFLFLFFDELFDRKKTVVAVIAALLFAVHPIHTEVVANIKSRDELLCFFFAFLSLNVFLKYTRSGKMSHLVGGALCLFLSFLSKETVITFLAVIPFIFFFYKNEDRKKSLYITVGSILVAGIFLAIRYSVLSAYGANTTSHVSFMDNMLVKAPSAVSRFATEVLILGQYVKMLFVPYPLICDYSFNSIPFATFGNIWVLASFATYLFFGVFGVYRLFKNQRDPYAFGILFFLMTIVLFSNIPFLIGAAMAERFLFFASAGFCLLIALLIEKFLVGEGSDVMTALTNVKVMGVVVPVCIVFAGIAINRNADWMDNITLFRADVKNAPNDARVNYYLGTEMVVEIAKAEQNPSVKKLITDSGIVYLKRALSIYRDYDDANAAVGDAYFRSGVYDSAEYYDKRALEITPTFATAINNLAGVYFVNGNYSLAIDYCRKALVLNPSFTNAYTNLGLCYIRLNKSDSALNNLYKAVAIDPNFQSSYENLVVVYKAMGKADSVKKYEAILQQLRPAN